MKRETGGIFFLFIGIILLSLLTTQKGRDVWAVLTGRAGVVAGKPTNPLAVIKGYNDQELKQGKGVEKRSRPLITNQW